MSQTHTTMTTRRDAAGDEPDRATSSARRAAARRGYRTASGAEATLPSADSGSSTSTTPSAASAVRSGDTRQVAAPGAHRDEEREQRTTQREPRARVEGAGASEAPEVDRQTDGDDERDQAGGVHVVVEVRKARRTTP